MKIEHFTRIEQSCKSNPKKFWQEIKTVIPKLNTKSIPKSLTANEFNAYFTQVPQRVNANFGKDELSLLWKGPRSIYNFNFEKVTEHDVLLELRRLPDKPGLDILTFDQR